MTDFNVRSDSVDVEQIMEQIRARIGEKRGVDYTEEQLRALAAVKLEKFFDPRGVRSDLLEQFKRRQPAYEPPILPSFTFENTTIYETHRGLLRLIRRLLAPILKLFFNPNTLAHALHTQAELNKVNAQREADRETKRLEADALYYEVLHNLVFEMTRLGIETKNLKMRVESIGSRLEFNERRARALENAVVYKSIDEPVPEPPPPPPRPHAPANAFQGQASATPAAASPVASSTSASPAPSAGSPQAAGTPEGPGQRSRRRRRRRGRRGGAPAVAMMGAGQPAPSGFEEPASQRTPAQQTAAEEPRMSLEQAFATDAQPTETRAEASSTPPAEPPPPKSAGPGPDNPDADDQQ
jgi:hypothetical protein